eukprot:14610728-Ditylum_brightwellii.AAC.1
MLCHATLKGALYPNNIDFIAYFTFITVNSTIFPTLDSVYTFSVYHVAPAAVAGHIKKKE